jgi:hypothetical protein
VLAGRCHKFVGAARISTSETRSGGRYTGGDVSMIIHMMVKRITVVSSDDTNEPRSSILLYEKGPESQEKPSRPRVGIMG